MAPAPLTPCAGYHLYKLISLQCRRLMNIARRVIDKALPMSYDDNLLALSIWPGRFIIGVAALSTPFCCGAVFPWRRVLIGDSRMLAVGSFYRALIIFAAGNIR